MRAEISQAIEQRARTIALHWNVLDQAMGGRNALLEQQIRELKHGIEKLQRGEPEATEGDVEAGQESLERTVI